METKEKFTKYFEIFNKYFISQNNCTDKGEFIPAEKVVFENGKSKTVYFGDGTINMSHYLTFLCLGKKITDNDGIILTYVDARIKNTVSSLYRLIGSATEVFKMEMIKSDFFIRDDVQSDMAYKFNSEHVQSAWSGSIEKINEDPCYSPFQSQDQIWNLAPILGYLNSCGSKPSVFIGNVIRQIIKDKHVIYNPYLSRIVHYWTYLPSMNEKKVKWWDREEDRDKKYKPMIKVKRGANNWYFAYGFRQVYRQDNVLKKTFADLIYASIYYPLTMMADLVWFPFLKKFFKIEPKDTSYYSLACAGEVWYFGRNHFLKRLFKKFNQDGTHWQLIAVEVMKDISLLNLIDIKRLKERVELYPEPSLNGTMFSPLPEMSQYILYIMCIKNENRG